MNKLIFMLIVAFASFVTHAMFDYGSYKATSFSDLLAQEKAFLAENGLELDSTLFTGQPEKYLITIKYSGKFVDMNHKQQEFLENWQKSNPNVSSFVQLYKKALVVEGLAIPIEIPVQQSLISSFVDELKIGQEIKIYVVNAGWGNNQPMLLVTEFAQP